MTPIGVLDDSKMLDLPVSIAVMKFIKFHLHNIHKVQGGFQRLLCLQTGVKLEAVKFTPCLLHSGHEHLDL